jgi:hypothetical protein
MALADCIVCQSDFAAALMRLHACQTPIQQLNPRRALAFDPCRLVRQVKEFSS